MCVYSHKVHLELGTTVHALTHELSTNVHIFTHELSTTVRVLTQGSFGIQHKCARTHTRFIWNSAQLCKYLHMNSAQLCMYSHMNLAQLCVYSNKVHLELSTTVHALTQGSYGTQHNCACIHT